MKMFSSQELAGVYPRRVPVNPILSDVRRYVEERSRMNQPKGWPRVLQVFSAAASYGHFVTGKWERITSPDQIEHARKVLTRLANLTKEDA